MTEFQKRVYPVRKFKNKQKNQLATISKFSNRVYAIVKKIPRGQVLTYKEIAVKLGNQRLARAVGNALNKNTNQEIPCHRVIRSDGQIGGFAKGSLKKIEILKKEGIKVVKNKISKEVLWIKASRQNRC